jgi:hypothetical protein
MVGKVEMTPEQQAALALIRELHAMGAEVASVSSVGGISVTFARDQREVASVDQGELITLRSENASLRELLKQYQEG